MNFSRRDGEVTFTLTEEDFERLLMAIGIATGAAMRESEKHSRWLFRLTNSINEGNPNFTPYAVPEDIAEVR